MLLKEVALIPDIFSEEEYSSPKLCDIHLLNLKDRLVSDVIVRNLRSGGWSDYIQENGVFLSKRSKEILKKLMKSNRLRPAEYVLDKTPGNASEWCQEAEASHEANELAGIITTERTANFSECPVVEPIDKLRNVFWWQKSNSLSISRSKDEYLRNLQLVLIQANYLIFIDRYLDPRKPQYFGFKEILVEASREDRPQPRIEIHRSESAENRGSKSMAKEKVSETEWENIFRGEYQESLASVGIEVEIFFWQDGHLHDRHLLSDVVGVLAGNGFDTGHKETTWARMDSPEIERTNNKYDPQRTPGPFSFSFRVGKRIDRSNKFCKLKATV